MLLVTKSKQNKETKLTVMSSPYGALQFCLSLFSPGITYPLFLKVLLGTSLVVQWLRIHPARQGTWVQSLVGELRAHMLWGQLSLCTPTTKSMCHNLRSCMMQLNAWHSQIINKHFFKVFKKYFYLKVAAGLNNPTHLVFSLKPWFSFCFTPSL